ncbi:putative holin-like toxin [Caenibacillus caldisaponilyticus]|nr:putative holin-like toxin [Caenibacillus caldisaponilyticus]
MISISNGLSLMIAFASLIVAVISVSQKNK